MRDTLTRIGFPESSISYFENLSASMTEEDKALFSTLQDAYFLRTKTEQTPHEINIATEQRLGEWAETKGFSRYTANMLFLVLCLPELHQRYQEKNLPDEMFYCICSDLTNKLIECQKMHGVDGTFVFYWFHRHFMMELFGLGRFQYEARPFPLEDLSFYRLKDGSITVKTASNPSLTTVDTSDMVPFFVLKKDSTVYNFHIPSSGPLTQEERFASYRKAYEFFDVPENEPIALICDSWLLWPDHEFIFPAGSNLKGFFDDFCHLTSRAPREDQVFPDDWRVYYKHYEGDVSALPQETTLQKNIANHLANGGVIGSGFGVILFDGEKIISK